MLSVLYNWGNGSLDMLIAHSQKWARGRSNTGMHCPPPKCSRFSLIPVLRDPKIQNQELAEQNRHSPSDSPSPHQLFHISGVKKLLCYLSDLCDLVGSISLTFLLHLTEATLGRYMFAQRHSRPSASTHKSQSLWEGSHLWAEHGKCWTVSNNLYHRVISDWKWKRFLDPPNAERGRKSYNFMPATHVSYGGGNILAMTWMLCVAIKICLAKAVAQFEAHLRVCVILGLRQDLQPI